MGGDNGWKMPYPASLKFQSSPGKKGKSKTFSSNIASSIWNKRLAMILGPTGWIRADKPIVQQKLQ